MKKLLTTALLVILSFTIFSQVEIGSSTDFTEVETDGTIEFHGDATVWDDYVVPFAAVKIKKEIDAPIWEVFIGDEGDGIYQYNFEESKLEEVGMTIQLPHSWNGTAIHPHIHWSPEDNTSGTVVWYMEYSWVNYNSTTQYVFPDAVRLTATASVANDSHKHLIAGFGSITPETSGANPQNAVSSILMIRFYRDPKETTSGALNDTYNSGAFALSFDIHFEKNTVGSRQEYIK